MKYSLTLILLFIATIVFSQEKDSVVVDQSKNTLADTVQNEPIVIKYYQVGETKIVEKKKEEKVKEVKVDDGDQIKTLLKKSGHHGGFFAISMKTSTFKNESMLMSGIRTGWIVNRRMGIGFEGYGVLPTATYKNDIFYGGDLTLLGGTAGMYLEPIFFSNQVIHVTFPLSAGIGWLAVGAGDLEDLYVNDRTYQDSDLFWYLEPGANLEINVSRWFRIAFGVSKRFTQDYDLEFGNEDEFDQINYNLTFKVGRF